MHLSRIVCTVYLEMASHSWEKWCDGRSHYKFFMVKLNDGCSIAMFDYQRKSTMLIPQGFIIVPCAARSSLHDQQMRTPLVGFHHFLQNRRQVGWRLAIGSDTLRPIRSDTKMFTENTHAHTHTNISLCTFIYIYIYIWMNEWMNEYINK